jgi:hypothetical protein
MASDPRLQVTWFKVVRIDRLTTTGLDTLKLKCGTRLSQLAQTAYYVGRTSVVGGAEFSSLAMAIHQLVHVARNG